MTKYTVTTQKQLDDALAKATAGDDIDIRSKQGVWLEISTATDAYVRAFDSASVSAGKYVSVHLHSQRVKLDGGVRIDMTAIDQSDPATWLDMHGIHIQDGHVTLYKAVGADLRSNHGMAYPIGQTVTASDWRPTNECGDGLHFRPTPDHAEAYHSGNNVRYLACRIPVADLQPITDGGAAKAKARTCVVLHEVDVMGCPINVETKVA